MKVLSLKRIIGMVDVPKDVTSVKKCSRGQLEYVDDVRKFGFELKCENGIIVECDGEKDDK